MSANNRVVFNPLPWQVAAWKDKSKVLLLDGPAGTGKSHIAAHKMAAFCHKYSSATALVVRKTRESMTNSTLLFLEFVVLGGHATHKAHNKRFEFANRSIIAYGGMKDDKQRQAIRSIGLLGGVDFIWMEEANLFTEADYEESIGRLRGKAAPWVQLLLTCNPDSDQHWIYKRLILGNQATRITARTAENTYLPEDYAEDTLGNLTGVRRKRLKDGIWVGAEGAVYEDYRYEVHVIEPFDIPADWRRFRSIDFGYRNPFVCQWWAMDHDGRLYLYREIYMTERTVADHADEIKRVEAGFERDSWDELTDKEKTATWRENREYIEFSVADHDAEDRATLRKLGIATKAANKAMKTGIEAVQHRMRVDDSGKPAIYFFNHTLVELDRQLDDEKKPTRTIDEITGYVWEPSRENRAEKEHPQKLDDHGMDAMRYMVAEHDTRARKGRAAIV